MSETTPFGIIVHCHLRWDFVWQRPQQIVSRLAERHPVLFLEDAAPLPENEAEPRFALTHVGDSLTVARPLLHPHTGDAEADAETDRKNGAAWERLADTVVAHLKTTDPAWENIVHWIYTPTAVGVQHRYDPVAVVYDCMDELANFKNAPPHLKAQEAELMNAADVVFTGGPSMYAARKDKYPNVHLFNSGVDVAHFRRALLAQTLVPEGMADLPTPRFLYYGVIDERMGWDNLAAVCDAHPEWSVLMVGPLAKITEEDLLRRPNLHYTGQRTYDELPGYLKGCDVALVPFALSDATKYLSPTKTLEYFAARRPVVSTLIADIVEYYSDAARIAHTPDEFVWACEAALVADNTERLDRGQRYA
ncbi:MAG: glycosyltransferase, partial [Armatimonadetes bacterium]|nr:glycosyltransferase [Armatimonadota bacterium]